MLLNLQFIFRKGATGCCVRIAVKMFWAGRGSFTEKGLEKPEVSSVALPLLGHIRCVFPLRSGISHVCVWKTSEPESTRWLLE